MSMTTKFDVAYLANSDGWIGRNKKVMHRLAALEHWMRSAATEIEDTIIGGLIVSLDINNVAKQDTNVGVGSGDEEVAVLFYRPVSLPVFQNGDLGIWMKRDWLESAPHIGIKILNNVHHKSPQE